MRRFASVVPLALLALGLSACSPATDDETTSALNGAACSWVDTVATQANNSMISADPTALVTAGDHLREGISLPDGDLKDAIAAAGDAAPELESTTVILPEDLDSFNEHLDSVSSICVDLGQDEVSTRVKYPDSQDVVEVLDGSYGG
ncbi:hypothetical protein HWD99_00880 [Microbacterium sp. C5A9]|uniref:hypothetical protein n=1 Tax=Microbacterium sp. C5A9 TaxID=2736663 RepID=UPI001F51E726|nr:hypothetical protein [Microbacterium sp. C5A9]MCI1017169.1 hypothetical protein [Microbacterium sp. C5A9]